MDCYMQDKMDPHEGFESEIRTLVTFLCDCVSIGVAKICEEAAILQGNIYLIQVLRPTV